MEPNCSGDRNYRKSVNLHRMGNCASLNLQKSGRSLESLGCIKSGPHTSSDCPINTYLMEGEAREEAESKACSFKFSVFLNVLEELLKFSSYAICAMKLLIICV